MTDSEKTKKEQQIKDICKLICATCAQFDGCAINCKAHRDTAEALYNAGYRKTFTSDLASDTQKAYTEGYIKGFADGEEQFEIIKNRNAELIKELDGAKAVKEFKEYENEQEK